MRLVKSLVILFLSSFIGITLNAEMPFASDTVAITDINNDGYIEILTAINTFADRTTSYYCTSFVRIIDTKLKDIIEIVNYKNINYFKENEAGIISIYNANGVMPVVDDLHDGILDGKYFTSIRTRYN